MLSRSLALFLTLGLGACAEPGGSTISLGDGGLTVPVRDAAVLALAQVAEPLPPEAVRLSPPESCSDGWQRVDLGPTSYCRPFAEQPPQCGDTELTLPGRGCVPVGGTCPVGLFAEDTVAGALFVTPGNASPEDDGSREHPFHSIQQALEAAPADGDVYASMGVFSEIVTIRRGVSLHGACASGTILEAQTQGEGVLQVRAIDGHLRDVSIRQRADLTLDSNQVGLAIASGSAERVIISHFQSGLVAVNETSTVNHILIRDVRYGVTTGTTGNLSATGISIEAHNTAVTLFDESELSVEGSFLSVDVSSLEDPASSLVVALEDTRFSLARSALWNSGMELTDNAVGVLEGVHIERCDARIALRTTSSSHLEANRVTLIDSNYHGLFAQGQSSATLRDMVLVQGDDYWTTERRYDYRNQLGYVEGWGAQGFKAVQEAEVSVERAFFSGISNNALTTGLGTDASIVASDIWVEDLSGDTLTTSSGTIRSGSAVALSTGTIDVERLHVEDAFGGVVVFDGHATVSDVSMSSLREGITLIGWNGKEAQLSLERASLSEVHQGIVVNTGDRMALSRGHLEGQDIAIRGTYFGISAMGAGATARLKRVRVDEFVHHGLLSALGGDLEVEDFSSNPLHLWAEHHTEIGAAIWLHDANLAVHRASLQGTWSALMVSVFSPAASLNITDLSVHDSPVGSTIQTSASQRLLPTLQSIRNANVSIPLQSGTSLPVPTFPTFGELE